MSTPPTKTTLPQPTRTSTRREQSRLARLIADRSIAGRLRAEHLALVAIVALAAVMNTYALSQNGWANGFYSAGVKSMLRSLHNFVFVSSDPSGLISIDKPPLSLWLQVASAKAFGFTPLSVLLPEAICGVACVIVLYLALARPLGRGSALGAALCLAIFPAFVAISRDNNPDALLILLMSLACLTALKAIESGRLRSILLCGLLIGLAFNVKTLAAWLVVPPIAFAYLLCGAGTLQRRLTQLLAAGVLMAVISLAWLTFVDLTPASKRPWVGSSRNNSELSLTFAYNGFGRLNGEVGGPGAITSKRGAYAPLAASRSAAAANKGPLQRLGAEAQLAFARHARAERLIAARRARERVHPPLAKRLDGRSRKPTPFAQPPGLLRLFGRGLGGQAGWLLPLAFGGMLALAGAIWLRDGLRDRAQADRGESEQADHRASTQGDRRASAQADRRASAQADRSHPQQPASSQGGVPSRRRDKRLPVLIVFGGWLLLEAIFLSVAKGIVHPYYASALAPGAAAMAGAALVFMLRLLRAHIAFAALLAATVAATVFVEVSILHNDHYLRWLGLALLAVCAVATLAILALRLPFARSGRWAQAGQSALGGLLLAALLCAPSVYSADTWNAPVQGTFPVAGPWGAAGYGGVDTKPDNVIAYRLLLAYLAQHEPSTRITVLTVSSVTSAPIILMGSDAASLAGYSGTDPAVNAKRLSALVASGQARYVLLGGPYSSRGGNGATKAALARCKEVPPGAWGYVRTNRYSFALFDCKGKAGALGEAG